MRRLLSLLVLLMVLLLLPAGVAAQTRGTEPPPDALDGLDPVLLVQGKPVEGKSAFTTVHGSFTYLFSSAETKAAFLREPAKYEIQLGGLCARMGKTTGANPADYVVHKGKIYIFGSDECHRRFIADRIYASNGDFGAAPFAAVEVKTGDIVWRDRSVARSTLVAAGDTLLILDEDGTLALATPTATGLAIGAKAAVLSGRSWTVPTLSSTTLYLRNATEIVALDLSPSATP